MSTYLQRLVEDAGVVELRHQAGLQWRSGLFNDADALQRAIWVLEAEGNVYTTLNQPAKKWADNSMMGRALKDADIGVICRLPFDIDPIRPTGTASTDAELEAAKQGRDAFVRLLMAYGWPMPALGMSGNGAHALYRTKLKATPEWRKAAAVLYAGLRDQLRETFAELNVNFDVTVRNPGRIWRCYGTVNRKGDSTRERPHRMSDIRLPSGPWQVVPARAVVRTVEALSPTVVLEKSRGRSDAPISGRGDFSTLDIVTWFQAHGAYRRHLVEEKHAVDCPWSNEHTTVSSSGTDTVVWTTSRTGWPTFHCSHAHCDGRGIRDVLAFWSDADQFCAKEYQHG